MNRATVIPLRHGGQPKPGTEGLPQPGKGVLDVLPRIRGLVLDPDHFRGDTASVEQFAEYLAFDDAVVPVDAARDDDQGGEAPVVPVSGNRSGLLLVGAEHDQGHRLAGRRCLDVGVGGDLRDLSGGEVFTSRAHAGLPVRAAGSASCSRASASLAWYPAA